MPGILPESEAPYNWHIKAWTQYGEGDWTDQDVFYVMPAPERPIAPSNLTAVVATEEAITLAWQDNSTDESGFIIQRYRPIGRVWEFYYLDHVPANVTSFTDTELRCGNEYFYAIVAANSVGDSGQSNWIFTSTEPCPESAEI